MGAARYDIVINQGSVFEMSIQLVDDVTANPIDLTGATGRLKIATKDFATTVCVIDSANANNGSVTISEPLIGKVSVTISTLASNNIVLVPKLSDPYYKAQNYIYQLDVTKALPTSSTAPSSKDEDPFYEEQLYIYQLDITQNGKSKRYMQGFVTLLRGIV